MAEAVAAVLAERGAVGEVMSLAWAVDVAGAEAAAESVALGLERALSVPAAVAELQAELIAEALEAADAVA